ncbi:FAD-dependent oxidoreductase [Streptomyces sp. NPDC090306]|uniref:FAD-dependent oxidoreductase n=1 Tax=Streptomyces sp. NPDC090306 TaxID=3365961 RepID=UPI0037F7F3D2
MGTRYRHADVLVVGAGPVGLATAWEVARRGRTVHVLEQFDVGHDKGSSAGLERQWRIQYSQEQWARLALRTLPLWRELESASGRELVHATGSLWFGRTGVATSEGEIGAAAAVLDRLDVPFEWLTAADIERRFGFAGLPADHEGFHQKDGGVIDVRGTLEALTELALRAGATVTEHVTVHAVEPDGTGVTVRTSLGDHRADTVVIAAGAFADTLLGLLGRPLDLHVFRMVSAYFAPRTPAFDLPTWYAFLEPEEPGINGSFYGFGRNPWTGSGLVRAAPDTELPSTATGSSRVDAAGIERLRRTESWVRDHLPGLVPKFTGASTCLAALPADPGRQFFLGSLHGQVPYGERVVVQSAGWAFKFVPSFGRLCAELALGLDGETHTGADGALVPGAVSW